MDRWPCSPKPWTRASLLAAGRTGPARGCRPTRASATSTCRCHRWRRRGQFYQSILIPGPAARLSGRAVLRPAKAITITSRPTYWQSRAPMSPGALGLASVSIGLRDPDAPLERAAASDRVATRGPSGSAVLQDLRRHRRHRHRPGAVIVSDLDDLDLDRNATLPMLSAPPPRPSWVGPALLLVVFLASPGRLLVGTGSHRTAGAGACQRPVAAPATPTPSPAVSGRARISRRSASSTRSFARRSDRSRRCRRQRRGSRRITSQNSSPPSCRVSQRQRRHRGCWPGSGRRRHLTVTQRGGQTVIDPRSFARFDGIARHGDLARRGGQRRAYRTLAPRLNGGLRASSASQIRRSTPRSEHAIIRPVKTPVPDGDIASRTRESATRSRTPTSGAVAGAEAAVENRPRQRKAHQARLREIGLALRHPRRSAVTRRSGIALALVCSRWPSA